jgi:CSLREA domain-containing protein
MTLDVAQRARPGIVGALFFLFLLMVFCCFAPPAHGDYVAHLSAQFTGNTEVDIVFGGSYYDTYPWDSFDADDAVDCVRSEFYREGVLVMNYGYGPTTYIDTGLQKGSTYNYSVKVYSSCAGDGIPQETLVAQASMSVTTGRISGSVSRNMTWSGGTWTLTGNVYVYDPGALTIAGGAVVERDPNAYIANIEFIGGGVITITGATLRNMYITSESSASGSLNVTGSVLESCTFSPGGTGTIQITAFSRNTGNCPQNPWDGIGHFRFGGTGQAMTVTGNNLPGCWLFVETNKEPIPTSIAAEENNLANLKIGPYTVDTRDVAGLIDVRGNTVTREINVFYGTGPLTVMWNTAGNMVIWGSETNEPTEEIVRSVVGNTIRTSSSTGILLGQGPYPNMPAHSVLIGRNRIECTQYGVAGAHMRYTSSRNVFEYNTVTGCTPGIRIDASTGNEVVFNTLSSPSQDYGTGIFVDTGAISVAISGNMITGFGQGLYIQGDGTLTPQNHIVTGNTMRSNYHAVELQGATGNLFYNNMFMKGTSSIVYATYNTCDDGSGNEVNCPNTWNQPQAQVMNIIGGPFVGGNYWSAYVGSDGNRDGLGDTPYFLPRGMADNLPLTFDLVVNKDTDEDDADPDDGLCDADLVTDGSQCTLRAAITEANRRVGKNVIAFNIPGAGVPVIRPQRALPTIVDPVELNGLIQPAGSVVIDGTSAGGNINCLNISLPDPASWTFIKGLVIQSFGGSGVYANGRLDVTDVQVLGNGGYGIVNNGFIGLHGTKNSIGRNGLIGIYSTSNFIDASDAVIQVEDNGSYGIWAGTGNVTINWIGGRPAYLDEVSRISGNGHAGIVAKGSGELEGFDDTAGDPCGWVKGMFLEVIGNGKNATLEQHKDGINADSGTSLTEVKVTDNPGYGILSRGTITLYLANNEISRNGKAGLYSLSGSIAANDAVIQVEDNGSYGIWAGEGSVFINWVSGIPPYPNQVSRISGNGHAGIVAKGSGELEGWVKGMFLEVIGNGKNATLEKHKDGINADSGTNLTSVKVTDNPGYGIMSHGTITICYRDNEISRNGKIGLYSLSGSIAANDAVIQVENNGSYGIWAGEGSVIINWVSGRPAYSGETSKISSNGRSGIYVVKEGDVTVSYFKITNNAGAGIDTDQTISLAHGEVCYNGGGNISPSEGIYATDVVLCDTDMDGVSDLIEAAGPNNGDGNYDGVADSAQGHVASLVVAGRYSVIESETEAPLIQVVAPGDLAPDGPRGVAFQSGVVEFVATKEGGGGMAPQNSSPNAFRIRQIFPEGTQINRYFIYGSTPDYPQPHWYQFPPYDGTTGAEISGNIVTLHILDGETGDGDLVVNGRITVSGGPGFVTNAITHTLILAQGWNFLSLPYQPLIPLPGTLFGNIQSDLQVVWGYDNEKKAWLKYMPNGNAIDSLTAVDQGKGYWIYGTASAGTPLACFEGSSVVQLFPGWNLVGYGGAEGTDIGSAMEGLAGVWLAIWGWENGQWVGAFTPETSLLWNGPPLTALHRGRAYWIKMKATGSWQQ